MEQNQSQTGHPKGLYLLFTTEMWERFSYYGMRALFILYLTKALLFDKALASAIYGDYTSLVYLTPLIGGFMADRYWGNRKSIIIGGVMMAIGQFLMFTSGMFYTDPGAATPIMLGGLFMLIVGNGFFKPNISTMVGQLYPEGDRRVDAAFTIFYMGINLGAFIAPLVCGTIGDTGDPAAFKWGFLAACVGMILSLVIFITLKDKYIVTPDGKAIGGKPEPVAQSVQEGVKQDSGKGRAGLWLFILVALYIVFKGFLGLDIIGAFVFACTIAAPGYIISDPGLSKIEKSRISVIYIIAFFVIAFWAAFEQAGASLTFFAEEQTNRMIFGWEMPASLFQSVNPVLIVLLAPLFAWMWVWLGKRNQEPASPLKQAIGLFLVALGYIIIAYKVRGLDPSIKVSMIWLFSLYAIHTMGELCLSPIGLSMVVKLAPVRYASLLMGVWFLSTALANKVAGDLSGLYPEEVKKEFSMDASQFALVGDSTDTAIKLDTNYFAAHKGDTLLNWDVKTSADGKAPAPEKKGMEKFMANLTADPLVDFFTKDNTAGDKLIAIKQTKPQAAPKVPSHQLKQILQIGSKTKFTWGVADDKQSVYVLKITPNELKKGEFVSTIERWNLAPEKPSIFGQKINNLYEFFVIFIILAGVSSVILFFLSKTLLKMMHGIR